VTQKRSKLSNIISFLS